MLVYQRVYIRSFDPYQCAIVERLKENTSFVSCKWSDCVVGLALLVPT